MKQPHRLATILFADIQGYSAMMELDENNALGYLHLFQSSMEKEVAEYEGVIQNFYGDGCLVTFFSATDAVNCAVQLQNDFWKKHQIPVRIGIHAGEVVFKDKNVFGNVVNIASRIESIGIPGSVLLSKAVADQVSNNLKFKMTSLGVFEFKNLTDSIEVMAISDSGFQVPNRENIQGKLKHLTHSVDTISSRHGQIIIAGIILTILVFLVYIFSEDALSKVGSREVAENGLYILPFVNQTGDSTLDNIGGYSSMVIGSAIQSSGLAIVKEQATLDIGVNLLEARIPAFGSNNSRVTPRDFRFVLNGMYNRHKDSLIFISRIVDLKNNSTVHVFPKISGPEGSYTRIIDQLKNKILGYWATKDLPLYKYNPPDFQAYQEYLKAIENWEGDTTLILRHIRNCLKIDSTFYRAHILELELYEIKNPDLAESKLMELDILKSRFSDSELNLYNAIKARVRKMNQAAYQYYMKEFVKAPRNLYVNTSAMSIALALINNPQKAVEIGEYIDWRQVPYNDCDYCQDRLTFLTKAYIDIGREESGLEILRFAETSETDLINRGIKELEIRALVRLGRIDQINELLQKSRHQEFNYDLDAMYFTYWASRELILVGKTIEAKEFADQFISEITAENRSNYITVSGRLHLYNENYDQAIKDLKETLETKNLGWHKPYFEAMYAAANAFQGNHKIANEYIEKFSSSDDKSEKPVYLYNQAIVHCSLGNIDQAISSLKNAVYAGKRFYRWEFQYDPILKKYIPEESMNEVLSLLH